MAGDWIPIRVDLLDDPAVIEVSGALGLHPCDVVGRLVWLWSWANRQVSRSGHAPGVTLSWIDQQTGVTGFAQALIEAGWLVVKEGPKQGIEFPNWERWNSQSAKERALATRRQRVKRHANVTPMSRQDRDKTVTREEKRRGEREDTLPTLSPDRLEPEVTASPPEPQAGNIHFESLWQVWPRKQRQELALRTWRGLFLTEDQALEIIDSAIAWAETAEWREQNGRFVPKLCDWLAERRWTEVPPPPGQPRTNRPESTTDYAARTILGAIE